MSDKDNTIDVDIGRLRASALNSIPQDDPDPIAFAEEFVVLPSSARSKNFDISVTPWLREPIQRAVDLPTRIITMMKPVQSGGSVFGEVTLLYWLRYRHGFIQYNWSNDKRANERWDSRILAILKACLPVAKMLEMSMLSSKGEVNFGGGTYFRMQGAFNPDNLDSDSIPMQINEEVHAWEAGHLKKARNRSTAVWNYKSIDISNAGVKEDQLDKAFCEGTMQYWVVRCPGCGQFHRMRTRWDEAKPELGGLRYDADGCRLGKFEYNYNKLRPTIQYQMPCGFVIHNDDQITRRQLSLSGQYSEPTNEGAELSHRSYTYEAVTVDYIDWMTLIKDKHDALRARAFGDIQPWIKYCQERECIPYDVNDVPIVNVVTVTKGIKKNRDGIPGQKIRLFALDRQQGTLRAGELPHWWLVIRDATIDEAGMLWTRLVWEGKVETDDQVISILKDHDCNMWQGVADSGDDTVHVYQFCLAHGINAIKGGREEWYSHENGNRRIFSSERPLHAMINRPPLYHYVSINDKGRAVSTPDPREPLFWLYSKSGIRERLYWMRKETRFETPDDVSNDYRNHQDAEERTEVISPSDGSRSTKWVQHKDRNDLFVCEAYIAMQIDQAGLVGMLNTTRKDL